MMKIVFATNNEHKLREIRQVLGEKFEIVSLNEIGFNEEIPETQDTLEGNSSQKANHIYDRFGLNCFADDTGLEVDSLNGEPGVYAARYAGSNPSFDDNMDKLLVNLKGIENRSAKFRTVISLIIDGNEKQFEGVVEGVILEEKTGIDGFGYDPIFKPNGYNESFAEMSSDLKNIISHRGRAVEKLEQYLNNLSK